MKIVIRKLFGKVGPWYALYPHKQIGDIPRPIHLWSTPDGPGSLFFESRRELISRVREKFRHVKHLQIIGPKE